MKRRSPWLTFAACALLNGTLLAERSAAPDARPRIALSKAASAAEAELDKRGLSKAHSVSSIALVSSKDGNAFYIAHIEPPILSQGDVLTRLAFQVTMDGQVKEKQVDAARQHFRSIETN